MNSLGIEPLGSLFATDASLTRAGGVKAPMTADVAYEFFRVADHRVFHTKLEDPCIPIFKNMLPTILS